ncbi:MAG TPA: amidohydrolase [Polyangiaceae bacterium]|nr:amidohydrolase [Polyangiaceae bacterium]
MTAAPDPLPELVRNVHPRVVERRRDFHRHPELAYQEVRTSAAVREWCEALGLETRTGVGKTGVIATLRGSKPGRRVALRADMDALPIQEANACEYASERPGVMHACGHDAHTAMLLGVASVLCAARERVAGEVRFLFQPAEEGQGGAVPLIEAGALEGVDLVLGQHMGPEHPTGTIALSYGPAMAAADFFTLKVIGKGGHGAYPHLTVDPVPVAAQLVLALQTIVARAVDPLAAAVLSIGTIRGGFRDNVIAPEVELAGTVRTLDPALRREIPERIERIARGVTAAHGARHELEYQLQYPPLINHDPATRLVERVGRELLGEGGVKVIAPSMGGEDFAFYLEKVPGCFYWLGCRPPGRAEAANLHSPTFDVDEAALAHGVHVMARAALSFLEGGAP